MSSLLPRSGSARPGVSHWWMQRVTSIALVPLVLYFLAALVLHGGADYAAARTWIAHPLNAAAVLLLLAVGCYHAVLGLQVIVEDYVSAEGTRRLLLAAVKLGFAALAALSMLSVLSVALDGVWA